MDTALMSVPAGNTAVSTGPAAKPAEACSSVSRRTLSDPVEVVACAPEAMTSMRSNGWVNLTESDRHVASSYRKALPTPRPTYTDIDCPVLTPSIAPP